MGIGTAMEDMIRPEIDLIYDKMYEMGLLVLSRNELSDYMAKNPSQENMGATEVSERVREWKLNRGIS